MPAEADHSGADRPAHEEPSTIAAFLALLADDVGAAASLFVARAMRFALPAARKARLAPDAAEDLAHDALARAMADEWAALHKAHLKTSLDAWVATLVRNLAYESQRGEIRQRAAAKEPSSRAADRETFTQAVRLADRMTPDLWGALTADQSAALRLAAEGLDVPEIARRLNVSRAAVRDRLRRVVRRLRARLSGRRGAARRRPLPTGDPPVGRPLTPLQAHARDLWNAGPSVKAIAADLRCAPAAVRALIRRIRARFEGPNARPNA